MIGVAVYVSDTKPHRTKKYPFAEHMECPRHIEENGVTFTLVSRHYEVDAAAIDETQAKVREFRAKQYGVVVRDVIANDEATANFGEAA